MTAAIAFSLALFSHVLNHVVIRLQAALYELENPHKHLDADNMGTHSIICRVHSAHMEHSVQTN